MGGTRRPSSGWPTRRPRAPEPSRGARRGRWRPSHDDASTAGGCAGQQPGTWARNGRWREVRTSPTNRASSTPHEPDRGGVQRRPAPRCPGFPSERERVEDLRVELAVMHLAADRHRPPSPETITNTNGLYDRSCRRWCRSCSIPRCRFEKAFPGSGGNAIVDHGADTVPPTLYLAGSVRFVSDHCKSRKRCLDGYRLRSQ